MAEEKVIETMEDVDKLRDKDTKKLFQKGLEIAKARIKELEGMKLNPAKKMEEKKNKEIVEAATEIMADKSLSEMIKNLRTDGTVTLEELAEKISTVIEEIKTLNTTAELKKSEIKELFDIDDELFDLVAIINTKESIRTKYEVEQKAAKEEADKYVADKTKEGNDLVVEAKAKIKVLEDEAKNARDKKTKEHEYALERKEIEEKNKLQDKLDTKKREHNEEIEKEKKSLDDREKNLLERESNVEENELEFASLENKVAEFPDILAKAKEEAKEAGKNEANKINAIKESSIKKEAEVEKRILQNEVSMLKEELVRQKATTADLTNKLDKAYSEMREMATSALNASKPAVPSKDNVGKA